MHPENPPNEAIKSCWLCIYYKDIKQNAEIKNNREDLYQMEHSEKGLSDI